MMVYNDPNSFLEDKKLFVRLMLPILLEKGPYKFKEILKGMFTESTIKLMPEILNEENFSNTILSLQEKQLKYYKRIV